MILVFWVSYLKSDAKYDLEINVISFVNPIPGLLLKLSEVF